MMTGSFDVPVFGTAGVAFHAGEGEKVGEGGIHTPDARTIGTHTPRKKVRLRDGDAQMQPSRPKRKRATKVVMEEQEGGVQKKLRNRGRR
jgi:hypothetical protein